MPWKETCVMDGRMEMVVRINGGESVSGRVKTGIQCRTVQVMTWPLSSIPPYAHAINPKSRVLSARGVRQRQQNPQ